MTRRKTGCLLYPAPVRYERWSIGDAVARVTFGTYLSMCGKSTDAGDLPEADWPDPCVTVRPAGLCPRCWAQHRRALRSVPHAQQ